MQWFKFRQLRKGMSMIRRMHLILLGCFLSFNAFCSSDIPVLMISNSDYLNNRWSVLASIGYTEFQKNTTVHTVVKRHLVALLFRAETSGN